MSNTIIDNSNLSTPTNTGISTASFQGEILTTGNDSPNGYEFVAVAGATYTFHADAGTISDTFLYLYDDSDTLIIYNDDAGPAREALIEWIAPNSGTYIVKVGDYDNNTTGTYTLNFEQDIAITTTTTIPTSSFPGEVTYEGVKGDNDNSSYILNVNSGVSYVINGQSQILDSNGSPVSYNSGSAWNPNTSGPYTVTTPAGSYELSISGDNDGDQLFPDNFILNSHVNNIPATGFNVLLVLDNSGSMKDEINDMQEAVTNLLGVYEAVGLNTNIHVVYFDHEVLPSETQLFATNDFTGANTFINSFNSSGNTSYGAAATAAQSALEAFNTNAPDYTNHMFFISDGEPQDSAYVDFRSNIATLGIEINMSAFGFAGASTNSMDYFDNTNGAETISGVEALANNLLETLSTSQGSLFFSSNQLLANDTDITNASVTNVSVTSAEGSLVDLGNGYFQYTPSDEERYSNATNPTFTYTVNYEDISGNNVTATEDFVIQTSLVQSINRGTDSDDKMLFTPKQHDSIDGGAGTDTLIATNNFDSYAIGVANNTVIIQDANNLSSFITAIENYQFSDYTYDLTTLAALDAVRPLYATALEIVGGQWSNGYVLPELFLFPENPDLEARYDYAYTGDDQSDVLFASSSNDYINAQGGMDAVNALAGNDIIDGGLGSNFLFGGEGNDIFFADGRDTANETWTTIADFNNGINSATLWGYVDGTSSHFWEEDQGAGGAWNGITFRGDLDGDGAVDTSFTFTGLSSGDIYMTTGSTDPINGITESYYGFSLV